MRVIWSFSFFCGLVALAQQEKLGRIEGTAVDAVTLAPLNKVTVLLNDTPQFGNTFRTLSDLQGKFIFEKVLEVTYFLSGQKTGYLSSLYGSRSGDIGGTPISIKPGEIYYAF